MKEKNQKTKGITLIALVITIIVLLILAGVSIAMLTGQNGILTQAQNAKNRTEAAQAEEENRLNEYNNIINNYVSGGTTEETPTFDERQQMLINMVGKYQIIRLKQQMHGDYFTKIVIILI